MSSHWIVLKFGGSSVAVAAHWQTIARQIRLQLAHGRKVLLVLSALKNVSNLLEALLHQAKAGVHSPAINHLREMHYNFAAELGLTLNHQLEPLFEALEKDCAAVQLQQQITPKLHAKILAYGELLSSTIGAAWLNQELANGVEAADFTLDALCWLDARRLLRAHPGADPLSHYTAAECEWQKTTPELCAVKGQYSVIVTQGFIASDQNGDTVLLGREGSDTSAAYFAALVGAQSLEIWTDVPGVFSFNPHRLGTALQIPQLSFDQARRLAEFGAKVLHPRCIKPVADCNIPVLIRSTHQPELTGTLINDEVCENNPIQALAEENHLLWLALDRNIGELPEQLLLELAKPGYHLLLCETTDKTEMLFRYQNSDQQAPDTQSLQALIARHAAATSFQLNPATASLTVCGTPPVSSGLNNSTGNNGNWMDAVSQLLISDLQAEQSKNNFSYRILNNRDAGRVTLLLFNPEAHFRQELTLRLAALIHYRMIIPQNDAQPRPSWNQLVAYKESKTTD